MKKCPKCGAEIFFDDTTVCPKCGHLFTDASSDISSFPTPETVTKSTIKAGTPGGKDIFASFEKELTQKKDTPEENKPVQKENTPEEDNTQKEEKLEETAEEKKETEKKDADDDLVQPISKLVQSTFTLYHDEDEENPCRKEYREDRKKFEEFVKIREEEKEAAKGHGLNENVRFIDSGRYSFPCFLLSMFIPPAGIILGILSIGRWKRFRSCLSGMATGLMLYFVLGLWLYMNPHMAKATDDFFSLFVPDKIITYVRGIYARMPYEKLKGMIH